MLKASVDFGKITGVIKPMHSTVNGPVNSEASISKFQKMGVPMVRTHDSSAFNGYGGGHAVDVGNIFRDFSADENDPSAYDFDLTDIYMQNCTKAGCKILYRLGPSVERDKKYNCLVPTDFQKYARVCEHIIRHFCFGWANGLYLDIPYWEIWNEADLLHADGTRPFWIGTEEQFLEFYAVTAKYLKTCFPKLKIGGPAYSTSKPEVPAAGNFVRYMSEHKAPIDFFSWHRYGTDPQRYKDSVEYSRQLLDSYGYENTELVLDEWNYVEGWTDAEKISSFKRNRTECGASFVAAVMLEMQKSALDHLMYYDARPRTPFNGLFSPIDGSPEKTFYVFPAFHKLYTLKNEVASQIDRGAWIGAAVDGAMKSILLSTYCEEHPESVCEQTYAIHLQGLLGEGLDESPVTVSIRVTDCDHVYELSRQDIIAVDETVLYLRIKENSVISIDIQPASKGLL